MSLTKMRRNMGKAVRPIMYVIAAIFVASCFTFYMPSMGIGTPADGQTLEPVVARVNGEDIPREIYERAAQISIRQLDMRSNMPGMAKPSLREFHIARGQGFEAAVDSVVRAQAAEKEGVQVSKAEVKAEIDREIESEMERVMDGATPQEKREHERRLRSLADENTVKRRLLMDRLTDKLRERFKPTEADLMASYNEVKVRHILIKNTGRSDAEALKLANDTLAKVKAGGDFTALAKQHSDDPGSKTQGGDVGWITATSGFVPEFSDAARKLKKGEVSPVVKTMYGYHILKADDVRSKLPKDINDKKRKQEYLDQFTEQTISNKMQNYFSTLRLAAKIDAIDPFVSGYMLENQSMGGDPAESQKLLAQSIQQYEKAAARNDLAAGPALHAKLAELYNRTQQDDKALKALDKVLVDSPNPDLYIMQGEILKRKKKNPEAIKAYENAMKVADNQPWLFLQLQQEFKSMNRDDLAKKAYARWNALKDSNKLNSTLPAGSLPPGLIPGG